VDFSLEDEMVELRSESLLIEVCVQGWEMVVVFLVCLERGGLHLDYIYFSALFYMCYVR